MPYLVARPKPASQHFFTPQPSTLWDSSEINSIANTFLKVRSKSIFQAYDAARTKLQAGGEDTHCNHTVQAVNAYGTGLRVMEGLRLWVKDLDFDRSQIVAHDGKGFKHRVTILPESLRTRPSTSSTPSPLSPQPM